MSRTKKGAKGPGYEYWSKRPCAGDSPGRITKKITHKKERMSNKQEVVKRKKNMDNDMQESLEPEDHPFFYDEEEE